MQRQGWLGGCVGYVRLAGIQVLHREMGWVLRKILSSHVMTTGDMGMF